MLKKQKNGDGKREKDRERDRLKETNRERKRRWTHKLWCSDTVVKKI